MDNATPNHYQLLRTQVYEYLREALRTGKIKPGMFISINQVVKELGISRTPMRDALLQLQTEGFVTFLSQRGIRINRYLAMCGLGARRAVERLVKELLAED